MGRAAKNRDKELQTNWERADHNLAESDKRWEFSANFYMLRAIYFAIRHIADVIEKGNQNANNS